MGPYAVVLRYRWDGPLPSPEEIHAGFLGMVGRLDRALARLLHRGDLGRRPFTLTPLGYPGRGDGLVLRLSVLDPPMFAQFWQRWQRRGPPPLRLHRRFLPLVDVVEQGPWAGRKSWEELGAGAVGRTVRLIFCTPTSFRQGDLDLPLPVPRLVFGGLWEKWNAFAPSPCPLSLPLLERSVALSSTRVRAKVFQDGRRAIMGFVGWGEFRLVGRHGPEVVRAFQALADFAFFAGVGRKTTHGMGLVRREPWLIQSPSAS